MSTERAPIAEQPLTDDESAVTSWASARERLDKVEPGRTNWLATVRPDGSPHLMPLIAAWIDGAFYFVASPDTRKARNLADDDRCVIATASTTLPSMDIVVEGHARPLTDEQDVRQIAETFREIGWPLEARGAEVHGPNAPTAGPPPYWIFRMVPTKAFGLPGTLGMEQFDQDDLPKPTRWEFDGE